MPRKKSGVHASRESELAYHYPGEAHDCSVVSLHDLLACFLVLSTAVKSCLASACARLALQYVIYYGILHVLWLNHAALDCKSLQALAGLSQCVRDLNLQQFAAVLTRCDSCVASEQLIRTQLWPPAAEVLLKFWIRTKLVSLQYSVLAVPKACVFL